MTTPTQITEQTPQESEPKDEIVTTAELERKKLLLEIKDLERPFWKRPTYILAALPTLLAITALTVGFINGFFGAQLTKLDNQKHDLEAQIKEFEEKKAGLYSQNERLQHELKKKKDALGMMRSMLLENSQMTRKLREIQSAPQIASVAKLKTQLEIQEELEGLLSALEFLLAEAEE